MPNIENFDRRILEGYQEDETNPAVVPGTTRWEVIVKFSGDILFLEEAIGAEVEILNKNYAIVTVEGDQIALLYDYPQIIYIELPKRLSLYLIESMEPTCIASVHNPETYGLTGKGTLVAIIDSGIDYTHNDFRQEDGSTRILYMWDQTRQGDPPNGFKGGTEYTKVQIDEALASSNPYTIVPEVDEVGHGTAVAGVAAGNGRSSDKRDVGVAPEASLIIVKLGDRGSASFARTTELMRALKYVSDKAEELSMPIAVNLSYGSNDSSHDGHSLFATYVDEISQYWRSVIVVASGNEGSAGHHFRANIKSGETITVEVSIAASIESMYITIWKNFADEFVFEVIAPDGMSSGDIYHSTNHRLMHIGDCVVYLDYGQPTHYNESQEFYLHFQTKGGSIPQGTWNINVRGDIVVNGTFDAWLPTVEEVTEQVRFLRPDPDITLTMPSDSEDVICVGGYNMNINSAAAFSGRGNTRMGMIKPDLVAPAVDVISARAGGGYDAFSGTSMAAPFVTGSAALMMEWGIVAGNDPFLYGQRVKAFLQYGASRNPWIDYPNPTWGYGSLCLKETMDLLAHYNQTQIPLME